MLRYSFALPAAADPEGLFDYRLLRGGKDEGPALADLAAFFFLLPTAGELTADSTLFFFRPLQIRLRLRLRQTPSLLQFPYCFFFPSRTPSLARFFRLLFSYGGTRHGARRRKIRSTG
ncbi:hypothetical protein L249_8313 [Ophiocordyceps polyrhachis-furcata BCC 54312]|uniref:Uncharacterized protein n=1 Tax=Ophiocordyceps polyrhachis-furcata BCC 54312 TaxID=1330021 RepID=A0A367LH49_9HYPO|nr:hypothetical protein L249_8313 [Ophiocordyceps polyrhachis-furcata BCC 54312]